MTKMRAVQEDMASLLETSWRARAGKMGRPLVETGHYSAALDIGHGMAAAVHTDNVGTKVLIAENLGIYDTIGVDCIAMNVNDVVCIGAEPAAIVDYMVFGRQPSSQIILDIMRGLVRGAESAGVAIVGGETAVSQGVIAQAGGEPGLDLSATCVGFVGVDKILTGARMKPGDTVLGLESDGIHTNGFTLARKVLLQEAHLTMSDRVPGLKRSLGEELLHPARIYVKEILAMINALEVHAVAHITGGAYGKLARFFPYFEGGFYLHSLPDPSPIFDLVSELGAVNEREMYSTFNMGVGMCVVVPRKQADEAIDIAKDRGTSAWEVGEITQKRQIRLVTPSGSRVTLA